MPYDEHNQIKEDDDIEITEETWGFTVVVEHESGGKLGAWYSTMEEVCKHLVRTWNTGDNYVRIFPTQYKDRMSKLK